MLTLEHNASDLVQRWDKEIKALNERIEALGFAMYEYPRSSVRQENYAELCALRDAVEDFFVTESKLLGALQAIRGEHHQELAACRCQILSEQNHILNNLTEAIEDWHSQRPQLWQTGVFFFEVFCSYWELLQERMERSIRLAFPTYPDNLKPMGEVA